MKILNLLHQYKNNETSNQSTIINMRILNLLHQYKNTETFNQSTIISVETVKLSQSNISIINFNNHLSNQQCNYTIHILSSISSIINIINTKIIISITILKHTSQSIVSITILKHTYQ